MKTRLTDTAEDYLKAILLLEERSGSAGTNDLAGHLNVTAASVSVMIQKLAQMKLVSYRKYQGVRLTPAGRRMAVEVIRHHRLIELYLSEVMGVPWDQVHDEAERLEHAISAQLEERIDEMLGYPTHDPHGSPIPNADGEMPVRPIALLANLEPISEAVIAEVDDGDPEFLRYLGELGLYPGVSLTVAKSEPFNGPLTLALKKGECIIGREAAARIWVTVGD